MTAPSGWFARLSAEVAPHRWLVAALAAVSLTWASWLAGASTALPAHLVAALGWAALAVIDARTHRLPDAITYPMTIAVVGLLAVAAAVTGEFGAFGRSLLAGLALTGGYGLVWLIAPAGGVGFGDVKLAASVGLITGWAGWTAVAVVALAPWLLAGIPAAVLLLTGRAGRGTHLALGPYMIAGAALAVTWSALGLT